MTEVAFTLPVHVRNPGNTRRTNTVLAAVIAGRERAREHGLACLWTRRAMAQAKLTPLDLVPCRVTLVRVSAGRLDGHDAVPAACKWIVDGIAEALGIDDGGPAVSWRYGQKLGPKKTYAVEVRIVRGMPERNEADIR